MKQLSVFSYDEPIIKRIKDKYEIYDCNKFLGYVEMYDRKDGKVSIDYKFCSGRAYGGNDRVEMKEVPEHIKRIAEGMARVHAYRKIGGDITVWREMYG